MGEGAEVRRQARRSRRRSPDRPPGGAHRSQNQALHLLKVLAAHRDPHFIWCAAGACSVRSRGMAFPEVRQARSCNNFAASGLGSEVGAVIECTSLRVCGAATTSHHIVMCFGLCVLTAIPAALRGGRWQIRDPCRATCYQRSSWVYGPKERACGRIRARSLNGRMRSNAHREARENAGVVLPRADATLVG